MEAKQFFDKQLRLWQDARKRYDDLRSVELRDICVESTGLILRAQFNPARIVSTGAKIDKATITSRPCFLCRKNRPEQQIMQPLATCGNADELELLVNPFPILPMHFTIPAVQHQPQLIRHSYMQMYQFLCQCPDLMVFYNGPKCGASCPDHMHLQAGTSGVVPLQAQWDLLSASLQTICDCGNGEGISLVTGYACPAILIRSRSLNTYANMFRKVYDALPQHADDTEPMMNVISWREGDDTITIVIPRKRHRPSCYPSAEESPSLQEQNSQTVYSRHYLVSPGAIDMAGLLITPRREDFDNLTPDEAVAMLREVCLDEKEMQTVIAHLQNHQTEKPTNHVTVGIVSASEIRFTLNAPYVVDGSEVSGTHVVSFAEGQICYEGKLYPELHFAPSVPSVFGDQDRASFTLDDVTIGVNFHWQRRERQTFLGELQFVILDGKVCAINRLHVEDYLTSVISSEMSATSSLQLLKAHAVISRSWLMAQIVRRRQPAVKSTATAEMHSGRNGAGELEIIRWYDREDHTVFDVCADDHCQRYQGITRATSPYVREAIAQTYGQVLMSGDEICDARFSKCCGGMSEEYRYCWENITKPYLLPVSDPYCDTNDREVLRQVLNDYDQETQDFYRWDVRISKQRVSDLLQQKLAIHLGEVISMQPLERGESGRISRLQIVGTKQTAVIGKELEIRRALSDTHLYSSAFDVEDDGQDFVLHGKGWGHGVGLCQIGAAVMGAKGFTYDQILMHYYKHATIVVPNMLTPNRN